MISAADKTVHMEKSVDDGFGFHIVGSHPTSVSTVVAGKPDHYPVIVPL